MNSVRSHEGDKVFFQVRPIDEVLSQLDVLEPVGDEMVTFATALGRVTASGVPSPEDIPHFDRSTMDGYAVRAADVAGATESYGSAFS